MLVPLVALHIQGYPNPRYTLVLRVPGRHTNLRSLFTAVHVQKRVVREQNGASTEHHNSAPPPRWPAARRVNPPLVLAARSLAITSRSSRNDTPGPRPTSKNSGRRRPARADPGRRLVVRMRGSQVDCGTSLWGSHRSPLFSSSSAGAHEDAGLLKFLALRASSLEIAGGVALLPFLVFSFCFRFVVGLPRGFIFYL